MMLKDKTALINDLEMLYTLSEEELITGGKKEYVIQERTPEKCQKRGDKWMAVPFDPDGQGGLPTVWTCVKIG